MGITCYETHINLWYGEAKNDSTLIQVTNQAAYTPQVDVGHSLFSLSSNSYL